ncbi:hypothetical protein JAAARDRAFT_188265 [Jaapia argillacea MUCL 33604]|uniref:Uncharacterized protein n=1 Tax=Jaapia argillacea MUCL 33604 TaxID=933084 RepID=A0A067QFR2_9AGAM|nr:hypothetical protein JAAARDRAFT_188265 [Jaapia argillacea MUCL 33604]
MDHTTVATDRFMEEADFVAKHRFESFRLGKGLPSANNNNPNIMPQNQRSSFHARSHSRCHSRTKSISSSVSNISLSTSSSSINSSGNVKATRSSMDMSPTSPVSSHSSGSSSVSSTKRHSHHRRQSSVSTRRESAEVMGLSMPDLAPSNSEDNINLGDKDSIRRRALWALEGKGDVGTFAAVEIPDFDTSDLEKRLGGRNFDFPSKPSFPPGPGAGFGGGLSSLAGKRDSIGKHLVVSASLKDQLHTLLEEEEEDEGEETDASSTVVSRSEPVTPEEVTVSITLPSPIAATPRARPRSLSLRPLALTPDALLNSATGNLPTPPSYTPKCSPLRSLTLPHSQPTNPYFSAGNNTHSKENSITSVTNLNTNTVTKPRPTSLLLSSSPLVPSAAAPLPLTLPRRYSLGYDAQENFAPTPSYADVAKLNRRSSISYRSSSDNTQQVLAAAALPTPDLTPTIAQRRPSASSISSTDSDRGRPLSTSEHHFLVQQHTALLARIEDLERTLSSRSRSTSRSRPVSYAASEASSVQSSAISEPSDEMLQLVADLKAERDDMKRDVDGWRMRVKDLERQVGMLAKRVDAERRDAWVARERVGLLTIEKAGMEKLVEEKSREAAEATGKCEEMRVECESLREGCDRLKTEVERRVGLEEECAKLRVQLAEETRRRESAERELETAGLLATPTPGPFAFRLSSEEPSEARTVGATRNRGLGFMSVDSACTEVDSMNGDAFPTRGSMILKAVTEEEEDDDMSENEVEDELARYEDDDFDISFESPGGSIGSLDDIPHATSHLRIDIPSDARPCSPISPPDLTRSPSPSSSPSPVMDIRPNPAHGRHASLSKTWTFPMGAQPASPAIEEPVDRFFGCLDDLDNSPPLSSSIQENDKGAFGRGLAYDVVEEEEDEMPPFVIPSQVGVVVPDEVVIGSLSVVVEEDEEVEEGSSGFEFEGEETAGGIRFTFTAPTPCDLSEPLSPATPLFESPVEEESIQETSFSLALAQSDDSIIQDEFSSMDSWMESSPKKSSPVTPSSIPRSSSFRNSFSSIPTPVKTPTRSVSSGDFNTNAFVTPPTKRGGTMPSFIPHLVSQASSPARVSSASKSRIVTPPTFIPQPQRKCGLPTPSPTPPKTISSMNGSAPGSAMSTHISSNVTSRSRFELATNDSSRYPDTHPSGLANQGPSQVKGLGIHSSIQFPELPSTPPTVPPPASSSIFSPRLSMLTNFIPSPTLSWNSRSFGFGQETPRNSKDVVVPNERRDASAAERGYVSKEKQLEKLRARLSEEAKIQCRPHLGSRRS